MAPVGMGNGLRGAECLEDERLDWRLVQVCFCPSSGQEQAGQGRGGEAGAVTRAWCVLDLGHCILLTMCEATSISQMGRLMPREVKLRE